MHGRRGSRNTLLAGLHVRGDTGTFGELNTCAVGIHHPEITGLYTRLSSGICGGGVSGPEITGFILRVSFANYNRGGGFCDIQR